jgi:hypothetical protein
VPPSYKPHAVRELHAHPPRAETSRATITDATKPTNQSASLSTAEPLNVDVVASAPDGEVPTILKWSEPDSMQVMATRAKLAFAWPQRRFKDGSYLSIKLAGAVLPRP